MHIMKVASQVCAAGHTFLQFPSLPDGNIESSKGGPMRCGGEFLNPQMNDNSVVEPNEHNTYADNSIIFANLGEFF